MLPVFWYHELMNEDQVVKALAALAHPARLKAFRALVVCGPQGLTPGVMQEGLGIPATTLSFHLKELASAGLVTQERASRNLVYRAAYDQMNGLLGYLTENCCAGADCAIPSSSAACC
jgi:ArsR family transcriptional regulator, arsenate/arsenite/antimonite-responsive transcriptional repressor